METSSFSTIFEFTLH